MPAMALSLPTQWTLVASGLMAHADHVLSGEECERLMALVDEEVDGEAYAEWMSVVSDPARLSATLERLAVPPAESHRQILEEAWLMAVVDGERVEAELDALRGIATRLGVAPAQLEQWREAWDAAQRVHAASAVAALGHVLGGASDDAGVLEGFVHALPTTHEHRAELLAAGLPHEDLEAVRRRLHGASRGQRRDVLRRLAGVAHGDEARDRWRALGRELGLGDEELDRLADA
jgi:DnaJ-domain-containing protein 1